MEAGACSVGRRLRPSTRRTALQSGIGSAVVIGRARPCRVYRGARDRSDMGPASPVLPRAVSVQGLAEAWTAAASPQHHPTCLAGTQPSYAITFFATTDREDLACASAK